MLRERTGSTDTPKKCPTSWTTVLSSVLSESVKRSAQLQSVGRGLYSWPAGNLPPGKLLTGRKLPCGQTTVNEKALIHYIISINDKVYRPLQKCFKKIPPPKFQDKTVQSNIMWLNLNKINEIIFLQSAHKQGNPPHFTFMCRAQNADTHAHKQHRLSQNIFPVGSSLSLIHI